MKITRQFHEPATLSTWKGQAEHMRGFRIQFGRGGQEKIPPYVRFEPKPYSP
jgi:hypothetical protein